MNQGNALDMLTADEKTMVLDDANALVDDTNLSYSTTYQHTPVSTFTPSTGAQTNTYTEVSLRVHRGSISAREILASGGLYQRGDVRFTVQRADLAVTPTREDRLVVSTETWEILDWTSDPLSALWVISARLVKTA